MAEAPRQATEDETRSRLLGLVLDDLRPLGRRIVARMQQEMPAYADLSVEDLLPGVYANLELMLPAMGSGRAFTDAELAAFAHHGEVRAKQGIAIEELLRGWRLGTQALVDEMLHSARQTGVDDGMVLDLTRSVLAAADVAVVSVARGHRQAELRSDRQEQQRRADLVRGVLFGTLRPAEIRAGVEAYGLDSPPTDVVEVTVGLGPATTLDALASSFRLAGRAASTAAAFGLVGVYDLSRLGLLPAVLADDDVGEEMVRRYIDPVSQGSSGTDVLTTVQCYLANGMRVDRTASALFVHQNTVRYRLNRFEQSTGADLRNPDDVLEVWWSLQAAGRETPGLCHATIVPLTGSRWLWGTLQDSDRNHCGPLQIRPARSIHRTVGHRRGELSWEGPQPRNMRRLWRSTGWFDATSLNRIHGSRRRPGPAGSRHSQSPISEPGSAPRRWNGAGTPCARR